MKKLLLLFFAALATLTCAAQEKEKAMKQYNFWDNWFIQGQLGASYSFCENHRETSMFKIISPHAALSIGKNFTPFAGIRMQVNGWQSNTERYDKIYHVNYLAGNIDGLFNLTNIFMNYKENRFFNFIGILGLGCVHTYKDIDHDVGRANYFAPRVGLQGDFRLDKAFSLNIEINGNLLDDNFNGWRENSKYDGYINVLAGITYRFNKRGFELVEVIDPSLVESLNDEINRQREEINRQKLLIAEYKDCCEKSKRAVEPVIKEVPVEKEIPWSAVIYFRIDKSVIDPGQEINLYNVAQYLKNNPEAHVTILSHCDAKTGNPAYNQKLSERRSAAVAKALKTKYGISPERFNIINNGDRVQPYPNKNAWNRIVIFRTK